MKNKTIYRRGIPTNEKFNRDELIKVTKTPLGEIVINDNTKCGRSVYLIKDIKYLDIIKKKRLIEKNLRCKTLDDSILDEVARLMK